MATPPSPSPSRPSNHSPEPGASPPRLSASPKTVAVTGATGFVGRAVVGELLARGHRVRAMARSLDKAAKVLPTSNTNLDIVVGHVLDGRTPGALVMGADACIHLIGIIREVRNAEGGPQTFERMHVQATRAMLEACLGAGGGGGIRRYLHMSALGADPDGRAKYQRTKWEAEQLVRRAKVDWTIFRPSLIHGPASEFVQMFDGMCGGQEPPWYFIPYFTREEVTDPNVPAGPTRTVAARIQPIAVEDVAWCFGEALEKENAIGEVYNLVGPDVLDWQEATIFFRDTLPGANHQLPVGRIPGEHAAKLARLVQMLGLGSLVPLDPGQAYMAMEDSVSEQNKVHEHLGLKARRFRETVREYAHLLA